MKKMTLLAVLMLFVGTADTDAQGFLGGLGKKALEKAKQKVEQKVEEKVEKALDGGKPLSQMSNLKLASKDARARKGAFY